MSLFAHVPDGYYEESRLQEQLKAVSQPDQYSLQALMVIVTAAAISFGAIKAVMGATEKESVPTVVKNPLK